MGMLSRAWVKWCVAGAVSLAVVGCANSKDPQAQARRERAKADAARRADEKHQAEIDRKNAARAEAQRREDEKRQARLDRDRRDREAELAWQTHGASRDVEGWNVDKAEGSAKSHGDYIGNDWPTEAQVRSVDLVTHKQSARGAAEDAMLFSQHFDGNELNSLGRAKLDLLFSAHAGQPVAVYIPQDEQSPARRASVEHYWHGSRWSDVQVEFREGANEATLVPASKGLAGLKALESKSATDSGSGRGRGSGDTTGVSDSMNSSSSSGSAGSSR
jgi:hypothetical protein